MVIYGYLYQISHIRVQVETGEFIFLLFETFPSFISFTRASSREARAKKIQHLVKEVFRSETWMG